MGTENSYVLKLLDLRTQSVILCASAHTSCAEKERSCKNGTDPRGNPAAYGYDALDRLTLQTDPHENSGTFAYDLANQQTSTTDRLGRRRDFSFDNAGRKTGETWIEDSTTVDTLTVPDQILVAVVAELTL